jgi:ketosteroid isomerase-like protein
MDKADMVRRALARFAAGDEQSMLEMFHPEVEVWATEEQLNSGTYKGREEMQRWYRGWHDGFDRVEYEPTDFIEVAPELLVVPVHITGEARGARVSQDMAWMFEFDGELCTRWELHMDKEAALASARVWLASQTRG